LEFDTRLVQTAVVGAPNAHDPVIMPMTRFEAKRFLGSRPEAIFWCGTWLGGCGRKLMTRVGIERIPHFAHWPTRGGQPCHRIHNGRRSADHLFVSRDLSTWARGRGHMPAVPVLSGDFQSGGTCTCLQLTLHGGRGGCDGFITVVFKGFEMWDWRRHEAARPTGTSWSNWMFGPGVVSPQAVLDRDGYALHLRLDLTDGVSSIEIGTRPRKGATEWVELDVCTIEEHGISTPLATEIRTEMRRKRTVIPTSTLQPPAKVLVAPGTTVPLPRFRRALLRIGREHAMAGDMERAGLCARLGRKTDHESPRLPPWLWTEVRDLLGTPAPAVPVPPRNQGGRIPTGTSESATPSLVQLQDVLDVIPLDEQLIDFFAETGCPVYDDVHRMRWLRLATAHTSFLYEHGLTKGVDPSVLRGLEELAKRHVRTAVLDRYVMDRQPKKVGQQSTALNADVRRTWEALAAFPIFKDAICLGTGEAALVQQRRSKSPGVVVHQIVGVAALLGDHGVIRRLIDRALSNAQPPSAAPEPAIDWRTMLQSNAREGDLTWEWERTGPDHDSTFKAKITDTRGRRAQGAGPSKKAANREAAAAFIRRWMPHLLSDDATQGDAPVRDRPETPRTYERASLAHQRVVADLMAEFELPQSAGAYLAQALTHTSWVHENQREAQLAHQRDNTLLAHHGSVVADLLMAHHQVTTVLSRTARPEPGELTTLTPEERIWRALFARMRLGPGLMLSSGQRVTPEPAYANAMQAVLAVAWRTHGSRLLARRPPVLDEWIRTNVSVQDAATRLQRSCAIFGIQLDFDFQRRGEDHLSECRATAVLHDGDARLIVAGDWAPGGKAFAKKRCAEYVLNILLAITHSESWNLSDEGRRIGAFLLEAQLKNVAQAGQRDLAWCCLQGHLGTSYVLADDHEAYEAWSIQVGKLIGDRPTESDPRLVAFYVRCMKTVQ
jgi:dsRNA-specific ribonuclease